MLASGRFWGGVVTGVLVVYGWNAYKMSKSRG